MSERPYVRISNQEASTVDLVILLSMPIAIAVLLGFIGYFGSLL